MYDFVYSLSFGGKLSTVKKELAAVPDARLAWNKYFWTVEKYKFKDPVIQLWASKATDTQP